ncbi:hypothetical protein KA005_03905, partial [bacterium]|nr:hypothetical protein [bacterium]
MNEEYIEKHLARNVPLDFGECCERVRLGLAPAVNRFRRRDVRKSVEFDRYFKGMIRILIDGDVSPDLDQKIGEEIFEVQVRFEAIQKTIDYSVPAKPVHESLQMLKKDNNKSYKKIYEETRDINVKQLTGLDVDDEIPNDINSFRS